MRGRFAYYAVSLIMNATSPWVQPNGGNLPGVAHVQQRRISYKDRGYLQEHINLRRMDFPKGFFNSDFDARPSLQVQVVDILRRDDFNFDVILESKDNQKRCRMPIYRRDGNGSLPAPGGMWGTSLSRFIDQ